MMVEKVSVRSTPVSKHQVARPAPLQHRHARHSQASTAPHKICCPNRRRPALLKEAVDSLMGVESTGCGVTQNKLCLEPSHGTFVD